MNSDMRIAPLKKECSLLPVLIADALNQNMNPENNLLPFRVPSPYVTVWLLCHQFLPR